jgi:hypothetical protein
MSKPIEKKEELRDQVKVHVADAMAQGKEWEHLDWHTDIMMRVIQSELSKQKEELLGLIGDLVDDEDCRYDHHGYCQTHGWFDTTPRCPHIRAKELINAEKKG